MLTVANRCQIVWKLNRIRDWHFNWYHFSLDDAHPNSQNWWVKLGINCRKRWLILYRPFCVYIGHLATMGSPTGVDQFKYLGSTQTTKTKGTSRKEVKISLAQAHSAILWKTTPSVFLQRLNSANHLSFQYCSVDVRAGRRRQIWRGESKHLKTNATGGFVAYQTESEFKPNDHV